MRYAALFACALLASTAAAQEKDDPDARLRKAWPKLLEAWKATTDFKATLKRPDGKPVKPVEKLPSGGLDPLPDDALRVSAQVQQAMDAAGLGSDEFWPELAALKQAMKSRLTSFLRVTSVSSFATPTSQEEYQKLQEDYRRAVQEWSQRQSGVPPQPGRMTPVDELEEGAADLARHKSPESVDLAQDALSRVRKSLRDLRIMDDDTPPWLRIRLTALVRALALGEELPAPPQATPEQRKHVREVIGDAIEGDLVRRDEAVRDLMRLGEIAVPEVRRILADTQDAEARGRLRKVLGIKERK